MADYYNPYNYMGMNTQGFTPTYPYGNYLYNQPKPTVPQNPQNTQNTFQWVQGKSAAEAYLVAPNSSVILMDSDAPVIYFKSADQNGRYLPMKTYDLVERVNSDPGRNATLDTSSFVKRDEIADLVVKEVDKYLSSPAN